MKPKHRQLLKILESAHVPVTGAQLAAALGVSPRTIINYIAVINNALPDSIASSPRGYMLAAAARKSRAYWAAAPCSPQCSEERMEKMLRLLLLENDLLNINDFAEKIHISPESIKNDLYLMRQKTIKYNLQILQTEGNILLQGSESGKRSLLASIINRELSHTRLAAQQLNQYFPQFPVASLQQVLTQIIQEQGFFINDCLRPNLLRDILISIWRCRYGHYAASSPLDLNTTALTAAVREKLSPFYDSLPPGEINYLLHILYGYLLPQNFTGLNRQTALGQLPSRHAAIIQKLFAYMKKAMPFVELNDYFVVRFAFNIANLLQLKELGKVLANPQRDDMKTAAPFSFCLSLCLAEKLSQISGFHFSPDDAAQLSVHISLALKKARTVNIDAVDCGLLITPYFDYAQELRTELLAHFPQSINIAAEASSEQNLEELKNVQFIISTVPLPNGFPVDWITTNPILSWEKIQEIALHLQRKQQENRARLLADFLQKYASWTKIPADLLTPVSRYMQQGQIALRLELGDYHHPRLLIEQCSCQPHKYAPQFRLCLMINARHWEQSSHILHDLIARLQNLRCKKQEALTLPAFIETIVR